MTIINRSVPTKFISLSDTPTSYTGQAGSAIVVNPTETGIVFATTTDHYSFDYTNVEITIPLYQQMLVFQAIELVENININGKLVVLD